jgi:hypothetical protein
MISLLSISCAINIPPETVLLATIRLVRATLAPESVFKMCKTLNVMLEAFLVRLCAHKLAKEL